MNMGFVVVMGIVTVFICLIALIAIIYIMGAIINKATNKTAPAAAICQQAAVSCSNGRCDCRGDGN